MVDEPSASERDAVIPDDERDRQRRNFFYRDGTPATARALLSTFVCAEFPALVAAADDPERRDAAAERFDEQMLFFARAVEGRPEILRAYMDVAAAVPVERAALVLQFLAHTGEAAAAGFLREYAAAPEHALVAPMIAELLGAGLGPIAELEQKAREPIRSPRHLDLRWAEFMATGKADPLVELVAVLTWPDRVRAHLQPLLAADGSQLAGRLAPLGFRCDPRTHALQNRQDLDLVALLTDEQLDPARFKAFVAALPERPPAEVAIPAALKACVVCSLACHAAEHAKVLAVCEAAAATLTGRARLSLLEVLAHAQARRGDPSAALRAWSAVLELDPDRVGLRERVEELTLAREFAAIVAAADESATVDIDAAAGLAVARRCAELLARTASYHARAWYELRGEPVDEQQMLRAEWRARHDGRGRSHVSRAFWTGAADGGLADEWMDLGGDNYMYMAGSWIRTPPGLVTRAADDALVRSDRFAALLRAHRPDRCRARPGAAPRIELTYDAAPLEELKPIGAPAGPMQVTLTIDLQTRWLQRARVVGPAFELVLAFVAPARPFTLVAPPDAIDASAARPDRS